MVQILVLDNESSQGCNIESFMLDDLRLPLLVLIRHKHEGANSKKRHMQGISMWATPIDESDGASPVDDKSQLEWLAQFREQRANLLLPTSLQEMKEGEVALEGDASALLSHRELQTVWLLGQGKSISLIAKELNLSVKTISTYRARALEKLKFKTTAQLIRYAIQLQLRHKDISDE
jgi:DNA-binding CsgD family transcriptional regulator